MTAREGQNGRLHYTDFLNIALPSVCGPSQFLSLSRERVRAREMDRGDEIFKNRFQWTLADSTVFRFNEEETLKDLPDDAPEEYEVYVRQKNPHLSAGHAAFWDSLSDALTRGTTADIAAYEEILAKYKGIE